MNPILHELARKQWLWSATSVKQHAQQRLSSDFTALEQALNSGFPTAGMIHIQTYLACGELGLFIDILREQEKAKNQMDKHRFWAFICPPGMPNAEYFLSHNIDLTQLLILNETSFEEALWSAEQCAKSGACAGVFLWQKHINHLHVKKLELASLRGQCYCCWFNDNQQLQSNLPLSLSLSLARKGDDIILKINKQKTGWSRQTIKLNRPFKCQSSIKLSAHKPRLAKAKVVNLHPR
ncbi:recombinase A [Agaribacter flavus]|uniref:Recombinase A n=1 Tax=Agaribacter flavus TaxID=1902781 RepID=A0ABV7FRT0_9ALTE